MPYITGGKLKQLWENQKNKQHCVLRNRKQDSITYVIPLSVNLVFPPLRNFNSPNQVYRVGRIQPLPYSPDTVDRGAQKCVRHNPDCSSNTRSTVDRRWVEPAEPRRYAIRATITKQRERDSSLAVYVAVSFSLCFSDEA